MTFLRKVLLQRFRDLETFSQNCFKWLPTRSWKRIKSQSKCEKCVEGEFS